MNTIWAFILTVGLQSGGEVDFLVSVEGEQGDCWAARAGIMEDMQESGDEYKYWYIGPCEKSERDD
jgi:hypothetical protein